MARLRGTWWEILSHLKASRKWSWLVVGRQIQAELRALDRLDADELLVSSLLKMNRGNFMLKVSTEADFIDEQVRRSPTGRI